MVRGGEVVGGGEAVRGGEGRWGEVGVVGRWGAVHWLKSTQLYQGLVRVKVRVRVRVGVQSSFCLRLQALGLQDRMAASLVPTVAGPRVAGQAYLGQPHQPQGTPRDTL